MAIVIGIEFREFATIAAGDDAALQRRHGPDEPRFVMVTSGTTELPRMAEWRAARSSITLCGEVGGVCPMFEWSGDPAPLQGYRATRGPSFRHLTALEGSNVEVARNDDLGFRCAQDAGK